MKARLRLSKFTKIFIGLSIVGPLILLSYELQIKPYLAQREAENYVRPTPDPRLPLAERLVHPWSEGGPYENALLELAKLDQSAQRALVPSLIAALNVTSPPISRVRAARALSTLGPAVAGESVGDIAELLRSDDDLTWKQAAWFALPEMGVLAAGPVLKIMKGEKDPNIRRHGAHAIQAVGKKNREALLVVLEQIVPLIQDPDPVVVELIAIGLGEIGPAAKLVVGPVTERLRQPDFSGRSGIHCSLIRLLGEIGPVTASALPTLMELVKTSSDEDVREEIVRVYPKIFPASDESNESFFREFYYAFPSATEGLAFCAQKLEDDNAWIPAAEVLVRADALVLPTLRQGLGSANPKIRCRVLEVLEKRHETKLSSQVRGLLKDKASCNSEEQDSDTVASFARRTLARLLAPR
jgi:hypothetical protein